MSLTGAPQLPPRVATNVAATPERVPPVLGAAAWPRRRFRVRPGYVVLGVVLCLPLLCVIGITGYFRLSAAPQTLRSSVMEAVPGQWHKRFAIHVGGMTLGLVRLGSSFFNLPPEPKAALGALHGAEVGIYKLQNAPSALDYSAVFTATDKAMKGRGWERIVGVAQGRQFVAVYMPRNLKSLKRMACFVAVLNQRDLVVASARGNVQPLLDLAMQQLPQSGNAPNTRNEMHLGIPLACQ
jgi:hypothetical protein